MEKKKLLLILVIFLITFNIAYPNILNKGIDFINQKLNTSFPFLKDINFKLGLDLQGGVHLVYQADLKDIALEDQANAMQGLRDIIARRVDLFGIQEPVVQTQELDNRHRLIVELAGIKEPAEAIKMIGETPFLEFKKQRPEQETELIIEKIKELQEAENIQEVENWELGFEDPYFISTTLTGQYLKEARINFDQTTGRPNIALTFDQEGANLFEKITEENIGKPIAIYIDREMISSPIVQEKISGGQAQITGDFSIQEARELARNLNAGALPVPIELISQSSVGPTLGAISLQKSLQAGILGFLAIVIFMILFYRLSGFLASLAMVFYLALFLTLIKLIPITLTLAGIGGIILSIGMAVDANILIFSRIKEELKERDLSYSLEQGFRRSWPSIRDGNLTTLVVAIILFWFGTSFIQGFALTLSIGILISMISAMFVTKALLKSLVKTRLSKIKWIWV
ncbi:MAG: protein translocase subunit SecD [Candidatus Pacebacteria bacterium]|nr:protein translocase subunit SecD [Candidatus Paceibacterota bacterium]